MKAPVKAKVLRCAIFGLGDWAWRHVRLIHNTPGFELVAVSSRSDAAWQKAKAELPGVQLHRDHRSLLADEKPDLVVITTPHHLHAPMSIDAFTAGAHVIVEKPMATTMADARLMMREAEAADRVLAVYHNRRFDPWFLAAQKIVRDGVLGPLVELNGLWPVRFPAGTWRTKKLESGGQFFDVGAHLADYLIAIANAKPVRVSGHVHRVLGRDPLLNEDHAVAEIQFANGVRAHLYTSSLDLAPSRRFHFVGENGTLTDEWNWGGGHGEVRTLNPDGTVQRTTYPYASENDSLAGRMIYDNIAAHLFQGTPLAIPAEAAYLNIAVLLAAEKSASNRGAWIEMDDFLGSERG